MRNTQYCAASRTPDGMLPLVIEGGPSTYHRSCRCPGVPDPCLLAQGSQCNGEVLFDGLHGNSAETGRLALAQAIDPHQHEHLPATRRQRQDGFAQPRLLRSEEHTSELQSLMRLSYAVFCLTKKKKQQTCKRHYNTVNI